MWKVCSIIDPPLSDGHNQSVLRKSERPIKTRGPNHYTTCHRR